MGISTAGGLKEMKKLILILGNGFTIDLLAHREQQKVNIDLTNLFSKGDTVVWPDGSHERGFLSYKHCPSLWNLGARPNMDSNSANELIEDIITCANMVSSSNAVPKENNIYLSAYYELVAYLKHLFIQYNKEVSDSELQAENIQTWGWLRLIKEANDSSEYDRIIIITYNYDIFLERILSLHNLPFSVEGLESDSKKILLLKPHGSISFTHKDANDASIFSIRKSTDMYEASLNDFSVRYDDLEKNYLVNALIPPAGDSSRLTYKWANDLRKILEACMSDISEEDKCVISGLSYWHVDRREIDALLAKISEKNIDTYLVNPHPPKALSAVLTCVLPKHVTYSSSEWIGGIINGK